jgi:hypothetical protein
MAAIISTEIRLWTIWAHCIWLMSVPQKGKIRK